MKAKKNIYTLLFVAVSVFVSSCSSSSDDNGDNSGDGGATSISISVNAGTLEVGNSFNFSVKDNNNVDVTSQSTIFYNGTAISGASYSPTESGTFNVNAKYGELVSSNISVTVTVAEALSSIVLTSNSGMVLKNEPVTLTVTGNEGTNFTQEATFYVDGQPIPSNIYTAETYGNKVITATYDTYTSNTSNVIVGHTKKVLIEDYTGAWCGYCPRVAYGIELVENQTDDVVVVAIHRGTSSGANYDPYNYPAGALENAIGLTGYPTAMLNRTTEWNYPEPNNVNQAVNLTNGISTRGLGINSTLNGNNLNISVKMNVINEAATNLKLIVYVMENGLILNQTNYTEFYGGSAVIQDFEHNNVLRQVPTNLFGDQLSASDLDATTGFYVKTFNIALTSNIENTSNLSLAAFLVNSDGITVNSQAAVVGSDIDFD